MCVCVRERERERKKDLAMCVCERDRGSEGERNPPLLGAITCFYTIQAHRVGEMLRQEQHLLRMPPAEKEKPERKIERKRNEMLRQGQR